MNLSMTKVEFIFHFDCLITRNEEAISPITRSIDDFIRSTISTAFNIQQSLRQCLLLFGFWWLYVYPSVRDVCTWESLFSWLDEDSLCSKSTSGLCSKSGTVVKSSRGYFAVDQYIQFYANTFFPDWKAKMLFNQRVDKLKHIFIPCVHC